MPQLFLLKWKQWDKFQYFIHLSNTKSTSLPVVQSVSQLCLTLCDPTDCSTPRFPSFTISWSLLIVLWVSDASLPEPLLILSSCQFQWKTGPSDQKPGLYWTLHISALGFFKNFPPVIRTLFTLQYQCFHLPGIILISIQRTISLVYYKNLDTLLSYPSILPPSQQNVLKNLSIVSASISSPPICFFIVFQQAFCHHPH